MLKKKKKMATAPLQTIKSFWNSQVMDEEQRMINYVCTSFPLLFVVLSFVCDGTGSCKLVRSNSLIWFGAIEAITSCSCT